jgi:hypothetical protein
VGLLWKLSQRNSSLPADTGLKGLHRRSRQQVYPKRRRLSANLHCTASRKVIIWKKRLLHLASNPRQVCLVALTAVTMRSVVFWDLTSPSCVEVYWRFGETYCLHLQGRRVRKKQETTSSFPSLRQNQFFVSRLAVLGLQFDPEDGGNIFPRNVDQIISNYTASVRIRLLFFCGLFYDADYRALNGRMIHDE